MKTLIKAMNKSDIAAMFLLPSYKSLNTALWKPGNGNQTGDELN